MVFTLNHVKSLLENNSVYELRNTESVVSDRFKKSYRVTQKKLYKYLTVTKTVTEKSWVNETYQVLVSKMLLP